MIRRKRAYEPSSADDGYRVLVERLWPRGLSKAKAHLDAWAKEIAPSTALRQWYGHDPAKWEEFRQRYEAELSAPDQRQLLGNLAERARHGTVTLIYSSNAGDISNAAVLLDVLNAER